MLSWLSDVLADGDQVRAVFMSLGGRQRRCRARRLHRAPSALGQARTNAEPLAVADVEPRRCPLWSVTAPEQRWGT